MLYVIWISRRPWDGCHVFHIGTIHNWTGKGSTPYQLSFLYIPWIFGIGPSDHFATSCSTEVEKGSTQSSSMDATEENAQYTSRRVIKKMKQVGYRIDGHVEVVEVSIFWIRIVCSLKLSTSIPENDCFEPPDERERKPVVERGHYCIHTVNDHDDH